MSEPEEFARGGNEPIASQDEADQVEARVRAIQALPPAEVTPQLEDLIALEQERLAAWEASDA